jgi:hypothetical protein
MIVYDHPRGVAVKIDGQEYRIAGVGFRNGTQWDFINGIRNRHPQFRRYVRVFGKDLKRIWKRYKQLGADEYIRQSHVIQAQQQTKGGSLRIIGEHC